MSSSVTHWSLPYVEWLLHYVPELHGVPVYLRQQPSEIPSVWHQSDCNGFTQSNLDLKLRDSLKARDQWAGRGLGIVVEESRWWARDWDGRCALLLHETAHDFAENGIARRTPEDELTLLDEIGACPGGREFLVKAYGLTERDDRQVQKGYHGPQFVRAGLHLWWRCRRTVSAYAVQLENYGPLVELCIHALQDELERGGNLIELLQTANPDAFAALWEGY